MIDDRPDQDSPDGEFDARVLAPSYSSAERSSRKWEEVVLDSLACNYEDHPVSRRDESDVIAVELAALQRDLAVEEHWHSSDA